MEIYLGREIKKQHGHEQKKILISINYYYYLITKKI